MKRYVLGFLFDHSGEHVALIRKDHPAPQAGKLNGIGGKIVPGEAVHDAMRREFYEETRLPVVNWNWFGHLGSRRAVGGGETQDGDWLVELFRSTWTPTSEQGVMPLLRAEEDHNEKPCWVRTDDAIIASLTSGQVWAGAIVGPVGIMRNLGWILPMARDRDIVGAALIDGGKAAT